MVLGDILKKVTIFENISLSHLKEIENIINTAEYEEGEDIFSEEDPADKFYIVKTGRVKIYKISHEGHIKIYDYLNDGDFFGEMSILDRQRRSANAVTTKKSTLFFITYNNFQKFLINNPKILLTISKTLCKRLRKADREIKMFAFSNVRDRFIMCLINLSERYGKKTEKGILIPNYFTQQELADFVGTAREVISRLSAELNKKKLIKKEKRNILIPSVAELKKNLIE
ncbi:MAG: Crp/Fnr family transcriptional regulator [Elusimicrobiota bacterium]